MKKIIKNVSMVLSVGMLLSAFSGFTITGNAAEEATKVIDLGKNVEFNRVKISYHDDTTTTVGFEYSADGITYSEKEMKDISNEKSVVFDLGKDVPKNAEQIKLIYDPTYGVPKVELFKSTRIGDKYTMTTTHKGVEGNLTQVRNSGNEYYDRLFDGTLNFAGDMTDIGWGQTFDLYHDAVKGNKTQNYSDGITVIAMDFGKEIDIDNITMALANDHYAGYIISVAGADGDYREFKNVSPEQAGKAVLSDNMVYYYDSYEREGSIYKEDENGNRIPKASTVYRKALLENDTIDQSIQKVQIQFYNYQTISGGQAQEIAEYVALYELGIFEFQSQFSTDYELYDGAGIELENPVTCQRIVGELPVDMWYEGQTADGSWIEFRDRSVAGYSAAETTEIKAVRIKGLNKINVAATKLPKSLLFYSAPENLAKKAYEASTANVTVDGQAEIPKDLRDDPRADYMTGGTETTECLFDGDVQNGKEEIYNIFTVADPYRLTLKENSSITVKLVNDSIVDSINYYAGPQYTPKHYYVQVSQTGDFANAEKVIDKSYELADKGPNEEGHLSPFYISTVQEGAEHDKYYCSMREQQAVDGVAGQYVKITNDGVLKTTGENDIETLTNKYVILAKEIEIIGAELVATAETNASALLDINCELNSDNTSAIFTIDNKTDEATSALSLWIAVYDNNGVLTGIKGIADQASVAAGETESAVISGLEIGGNSIVKAFAWTADNQKPLTDAIIMK